MPRSTKPRNGPYGIVRILLEGKKKKPEMLLASDRHFGSISDVVDGELSKK
jgi:hypothetical protein